VRAVRQHSRPHAAGDAPAAMKGEIAVLRAFRKFAPRANTPLVLAAQPGAIRRSGAVGAAGRVEGIGDPISRSTPNRASTSSSRYDRRAGDDLSVCDGRVCRRRPRRHRQLARSTAVFGKPMFGPHMQNFLEIAEAFVSNGAALADDRTGGRFSG
jgi:hypothetical protein